MHHALRCDAVEGAHGPSHLTARRRRRLGAALPCGEAASSERPVACLACVSAVAAAAAISSWQAAASSVPRGA